MVKSRKLGKITLWSAPNALTISLGIFSLLDLPEVDCDNDDLMNKQSVRLLKQTGEW